MPTTPVSRLAALLDASPVAVRGAWLTCLSWARPGCQIEPVTRPSHDPIVRRSRSSPESSKIPLPEILRPMSSDAPLAKFRNQGLERYRRLDPARNCPAPGRPDLHRKATYQQKDSAAAGVTPASRLRHGRKGQRTGSSAPAREVRAVGSTAARGANQRRAEQPARLSRAPPALPAYAASQQAPPPVGLAGSPRPGYPSVRSRKTGAERTPLGPVRPEGLGCSYARCNGYGPSGTRITPLRFAMAWLGPGLHTPSRPATGSRISP